MRRCCFTTSGNPLPADFWGDDGWMPRALLPMKSRSVEAIGFFLFYGSLAMARVTRAVFVLLCGLHAGMANVLGKVGRLDRPHLLRLPQPGHDLWRRLDSRRSAVDSMFRAGRTRNEFGQVREVRAAKRKDLAASPPAFTSPWAFACTRLMQIQMAVLFFFSATENWQATTGGTAMPYGGFSPTVIITTTIFCSCWQSNTGWSTLRRMALS